MADNSNTNWLENYIPDDITSAGIGFRNVPYVPSPEIDNEAPPVSLSTTSTPYERLGKGGIVNYAGEEGTGVVTGILGCAMFWGTIVILISIILITIQVLFNWENFWSAIQDILNGVAEKNGYTIIW